jgi:gas vesicle protein
MKPAVLNVAEAPLGLLAGCIIGARRALLCANETLVEAMAPTPQTRQRTSKAARRCR